MEHIVKPLQEMNPTWNKMICEIEAKNINSNRISNIAITIDKVKHCLKMMNTQDPPIRTLTYREMFSKFADGEQSFRASLFKLIDKLEECDIKSKCNELYWETVEINMYDYDTEEQVMKKYHDVLKILKELSSYLRKFDSKIIFTKALADIIYLFCNTLTYFTQTESYRKFTGDEVAVRRCEVPCDPAYREKYKNLESAYEEEKIVYRGSKEYDPSYIWGQLSGWYKQSVDKPNASLSTDRRGTLSLPDLDSFDLQKPIKASGRKRDKKNYKDFANGKDLDDLSGSDDNLQIKTKSNRRGDTHSNNRLSVNDEESKSRISRDLTPNPSRMKDDGLPQIPVIHSAQSELEMRMKELFSYPHKY